MSNRTINRILISIICFLCITICTLIYLILSRPHSIITQGSAPNTFAEAPNTDVIDFNTVIPVESPIEEEASSITCTEETPNILYARTTSLLNLRASNSTDAAVIETVEEDTLLQVLEIQPDGWTKVLYEGQEAYVSSAYIILIRES